VNIDLKLRNKFMDCLNSLVVKCVECGRSRVESIVKCCVIRMTLNMVSVVPLFSTQHLKGKTGSISNSENTVFESLIED